MACVLTAVCELATKNDLCSLQKLDMMLLHLLILSLIQPGRSGAALAVDSLFSVESGGIAWAQNEFLVCSFEFI